ncbi:hypothetical protein [Sporosarcina sp. Te-1]|uniref:hypothetical protein n=1 Tax=Sporosarcina sp. Te-1 TaxID=2818390 RepID=UPI001A9F9401|nr:hypothetical protein [Sporosarcina sp. Te-1]QTD39454.1 hypothetical protein J3U78_11260 [Sporosarcina sp. Te-1]
MYSTDGKWTYEPRVQMDIALSLPEDSYKAMQLPDEWVTVMNSYQELMTGGQHPSMSPFQSSFFPPPFEWGWISKNTSGEQVYPVGMRNTSIHLTGSISVDFMMWITEGQLEVAKD